MQRLFKLTLSPIALLFLAACGTVSTMQTGRVMEKGQGHYFAGGGISNDNLPGLYAGLRYGIWEKFDVGGRVSLFGMSGVEGKYQFVDDERWAVSAGLGLAAAGFSIGSKPEKDPITGETKNVDDGNGDTVADFYIFPVISYDLQQDITFYTSPRYIRRTVRSGGAGYSDNITKINFGMKIGSKSGVFLEAAANQSSYKHGVYGEFDISYFWIPDLSK